MSAAYDKIMELLDELTPAERKRLLEYLQQNFPPKPIVEEANNNREPDLID